MITDRFITFEGGEGSGKSTQARLLADKLMAAGFEVVVTREPGGSPVAERIRALILEHKPESPVAEFLLFAAARAEHLHTKVIPALERGAYVVCDRFIDSTRVYQSELGPVPMSLITDIERATVEPVVPALTVVLDVPAEIAMARTAQRGDLNHYDRKDLAWHRGLRNAFHDTVVREPGRCVLIDGGQDEAAVARGVLLVVNERLGLGLA